MKVFSLKSLAIATALVSSAASAVSIPLPGGLTILEDDNLEYVVEAGGRIKDPTDVTETLVVGDTLVAYIDFDKVQDANNNTFTNFGATLELTGISAIEVTSIVTVGPATIIEFGPSVSFGLTYGVGAMAALFADSPSDFSTNCHTTSIAFCDTNATDGTPWLVAGFEDPDDYWTAFGLGSFASLNSVFTQNATTTVGTANYSLSILMNGTGYDFREQASLNSPVVIGGDLMTDIVGSGSIQGGAGLQNSFFARSDFDFTLDRIPEPGSLALLGAGLLLAGASRRRKAK